MTRYVFRFSVIGGDTASVSTTSSEDALKVRAANWSHGTGHYFTPWMDPMLDDADKVIPGGKRMRVNLVHTTAVTTYEIEDEA